MDGETVGYRGATIAEFHLDCVVKYSSQLERAVEIEGRQRNENIYSMLEWRSFFASILLQSNCHRMKLIINISGKTYKQEFRFR